MTEREELVGKIEELQEEVAQLRQAVVSHAVVDQAIGVVIALSGLRPEQGWEVLKTVSQRTNTKLREVAQHIVRWPERGSLPPEIRPALRIALTEARTMHGGRSLIRQEQRSKGYGGALSGKSE
ncbi:ANTAR domain-containing protein [Streptomyces sp. NPDC005402]|uniref:ANTAR domain-containing protein n=1 Tax=Streptomyces sp. NPDC005402 TaxID=3155338 RepID=UPI0033B1D51C